MKTFVKVAGSWAIVCAMATVAGVGGIPVLAKNPFPRAEPSCRSTFRSLAEFNIAAGRPAVAINFDDLPAGSDLSGRTIGGVTFRKVNAPLVVVRGEDTYTPAGFTSVDDLRRHRLAATTGAHLLSPGAEMLGPGPDATIEDDDVVMIFDPPVAAFGFDHLSQAADGMSYTRIEVYGVDGALLHAGTVEIGPMWPSQRFELCEPREEHPGGIATADFWGFVSNAANIREVRIDEQDDNNVCADSNIGLDTLRFAPARCPQACDLNGDGFITDDDVRMVWDSWGPAAPATDSGRGGESLRWSPADLDRNGVVDARDVLTVLEGVLRAW